MTDPIPNRTDADVLQPRPILTVLRRIANFFQPPAPADRINKAWNDPITTNANGQFRLYFQNPHGLPRDMVSLNQDLSTMQAFDVSCFCLAETNLNWHCPHVKMEFLSQQRLVWKGHGGAKSALSSIDLDSTSDFQTGGTITSVVGPWCTRVLMAESDPSGMSRWSCLTFIGRQNRRISIITGYQCVCSPGDCSAWTQEKVFLRAKQNKQSSHPQRQFIENLISFIKDKQHQGHDIIVALDANEVLGEESNGLSKLIHDCGLYDLMELLGADTSAQLTDTFRCGTNRRIDYILGTERPLQSVRHCGVLAFNDGIVSDHRGLFIDFDPTILFGGAVADPVSMLSRGFSSKNAKKVTAYVDSLERYWTDH
jgi:hypothetical protein